MIPALSNNTRLSFKKTRGGGVLTGCKYSKMIIIKQAGNTNRVMKNRPTCCDFKVIVGKKREY